MSRFGGWALYAVLLAVAAGLAIAASAREEADSPLPSIENTGAAGTRALFLYLRESGFEVRSHGAPLTGIPADVRTIVLPAPTLRRIEQAELSALESFAQEGGTIVVLAPRDPRRQQPALAEWLGLSKAEALVPSHRPTSLTGDDPAGVRVPVTVRAGPLADVDALRFGPSDGVDVARTPAIPIALREDVPALWWVPIGAGGAFVAAGPDLAENRRLELEGNLKVWHALASAGPMLFDEYHHTIPDAPPRTTGLWVFVAQLLALFVVFAVARGTRLGPPRPILQEKHRSTREYLDAFAHLTRRARVERELLETQRTRFRMLVQERLGLGRELPEEEIALGLAAHCQIDPDVYRALVRELSDAAEQDRVSPKTYARLTRGLARFERVVTGRAV